MIFYSVCSFCKQYKGTPAFYDFTKIRCILRIIPREISFPIWIHLNKSFSVVFSSITIFIAKGRLRALTWNSSQILILYKPAAGDWRQNASSKLTSNDFVQRFPRALGQFSLPEVYFQLMKNELRWLAAVCLRDQEVEKRKWREANSSDTFFSRLFLSLSKNRLIQSISPYAHNCDLCTVRLILLY